MNIYLIFFILCIYIYNIVEGFLLKVELGLGMKNNKLFFIYICLVFGDCYFVGV